jgi:hypothetical protein
VPIRDDAASTVTWSSLIFSGTGSLPPFSTGLVNSGFQSPKVRAEGYPVEKVV